MTSRSSSTLCLGFPQRMSHDPSIFYILESPLQSRFYISSFMQRPSYLTPPHSLVGGSFWNCASLLDYFYVFHASKAITTWMILSSIACLKCSLIPLYYCYSGICLPLRLTQGTCFHRLPFWISKLLWWCFQLRFSLLREFHKLGFWMDVWGLAFRELFLFPRCRTQELSFTMQCDSCRSFICPHPHCFITLDTRLSWTNHSFHIFLVSLLTDLNKWALVMP